jgi:uridine kinase
MSLPPAERLRAGEQANPAHVAAVVAIASRAQPARGTTVVVAIDGRSGSGKTLLGTAVADRLDCPVLHLDELYPGWDGLAAGVALATSEVLEPLARGERAAYRRWDWMRSRPGRTLAVGPTAMLVLEGCGALVPPADAFAAVRVWVEASTAVRRARALSRDGETYAPHWERWAAQEDAVYSTARPRARADLVLRTDAP